MLRSDEPPILSARAGVHSAIEPVVGPIKKAEHGIARRIRAIGHGQWRGVHHIAMNGGGKTRLGHDLGYSGRRHFITQLVLQGIATDLARHLSDQIAQLVASYTCWGAA